MGNGIELAKAYVQIVPSADGIQGKITEALGGESSKAGDAAGQLLGKKLVGAVAKVISAAGLGKILAESIASGGALQQSLGGVDRMRDDGDLAGDFYVQVGAFAQRANADALISILSRAGHRGRLVYGSNSLWNVQVGPWPDTFIAQQKLAAFRALYPSAFVVGD